MGLGWTQGRTIRMSNAKFIKRIALTLIAVMALGIALYFTFHPIEPDKSTVGMWLIFSVFSFVFAWPETIKSVSFLGSRIDFLEKQIKTLSNVLDLYWVSIRNANERIQKDIGLALPINIGASFLNLDEQLESNINDLQSMSQAIAERLNGIWDEMLVLLRKNGIDTRKIEAIPYYENPLFNPHWETINIGLPNSLLHLKTTAAHIAIKHYELMLSSDAELTADEKQRFAKLQTKFEDYARSTMVD